MKTKDSISEKTLLSIIPMTKRTLKHYKEKDMLKPCVIKDGESWFDQKDVLNLFGLRDLNEPLLTLEELSNDIGLSTSKLARYATIGNIPFYHAKDSSRLNMKGTRRFFKLSEVKAILFPDLTKDAVIMNFEFMDKAGIANYMTMVLSTLIDSSAVLDEGQKQMLKMIIMKKMTLKATAEALGKSREHCRLLFKDAIRSLDEEVASHVDLKNQILERDKKIHAISEELEMTKKGFEGMRSLIKDMNVEITIGDFIADKTNIDAEVPVLSTKISATDLPIRVKNALHKVDIVTIADLIRTPPTVFPKMRNFGQTSMNDLLLFMKRNNLQFIKK